MDLQTIKEVCFLIIININFLVLRILQRCHIILNPFWIPGRVIKASNLNLRALSLIFPEVFGSGKTKDAFLSQN